MLPPEPEPLDPLAEPLLPELPLEPAEFDVPPDGALFEPLELLGVDEFEPEADGVGELLPWDEPEFEPLFGDGTLIVVLLDDVGGAAGCALPGDWFVVVLDEGGTFTMVGDVDCCVELPL